MGRVPPLLLLVALLFNKVFRPLKPPQFNVFIHYVQILSFMYLQYFSTCLLAVNSFLFYISFCSPSVCYSTTFLKKNSQQLFFSFRKNCSSDDFHDKETTRSHRLTCTTARRPQLQHVVVHPSLFGFDPARFPSESERSESRPDAPYLPPEPPRQGDSQSISAAEALTAR